MAPLGTMLVLLSLVLGSAKIIPQAEARAFFVFGDSLVDNGNNNYLVTTARADTPPYGIDFPTHSPTGRFSNGYNLPDLIGQYYGLEATLPYLSPELSGDKLLHGANFASAGVGILNDTGVQFINIIGMYDQIAYFLQYQKRLSDQIGAENATKLVKESLVLITLGGNDFVNNYYLIPYSPRSQQFNLQDYCNYLISEYRKILQRLHEVGAERVIVTGTGPLGCVPAELAMRSSNGECADELQTAASLFNPQLAEMLTGLNKEIGSDVFVAANTNRAHMDFIANPQAFGFETAKIACCGQGPYNGIGLCTPFSNLCPNRDTYVFWDAFHPTERANRLIVQQMFNGSTFYMNPMNISTIKILDP
ncbi:GDSL esterase/lipase At5g33370-like [Coffea eugenioides]|uniref:GDSL esterase/lipase At5g33370 n=1 Tax=Coffea arabica TaxID=13443 RepID=A0A6P6UD02_COFAR|nr:GDSL esterase/lipase At5g33370-like [Coffea eugenioides]